MSQTSYYYDVKKPSNLIVPLEYGFFGPMSDHFEELPPEETADLLNCTDVPPFVLPAPSHHETATTRSQNTSESVNKSSTKKHEIREPSPEPPRSPVEGADLPYPRWRISGGGWENLEARLLRFQAKKALRLQQSAEDAAAQTDDEAPKATNEGRSSQQDCDDVNAESNIIEVAHDGRKARVATILYSKLSNRL
jgi:hypothetical protein